MRRRRPDTDRQPVPVEPAESGPTSTLDAVSVDNAAIHDATTNHTPVGARPFDADRSLTIAAGFEQQTGFQATEGWERPRSVPWLVITLVVLVLAGFFGWTLTRSSQSRSPLPQLPSNSESRFSFSIDGVRIDNVSVYGSPENAFVTTLDLGQSPQAQLYALNSIGDVRWQAEVGIGTTWDVVEVDTDRILVTTHGFARSGTDATITLSMLDASDGTIVWQTETTGESARLVGNHVAVSQTIQSDDITSDDFLRPPSVITIVDRSTGEIVAQRRFDHVPISWTIGELGTSSLLVHDDGKVFLVDSNLDQVSAPIRVSDEAATASDGTSILVVDDATTTEYDLDGVAVRSADNNAAFGDLSSAVWSPAHPGAWIVNGTEDQDGCGAYQLNDQLLELWSRPECHATAVTYPDSNTSYVLVLGASAASDDPVETLASVDMAEIIAEGDRIALGSNGVVIERDGRLVGTKRNGADPLFTLDLPVRASWSVLDGGIAVLSRAAGGAVTVEVFS